MSEHFSNLPEEHTLDMIVQMKKDSEQFLKEILLPVSQLSYFSIATKKCGKIEDGEIG